MQLVLLHCARSALCEAAESNAAQDGSPMPVRAREERACRVCAGAYQKKDSKAYHVVPPCADPPLLLRVMPKLELPAKQMGNPSDKFNIRTSCCFKAKQT
eukprot:scaffold303920_cov21-Tisochrysis_lutea.AAC.2